MTGMSSVIDKAPPPPPPEEEIPPILSSEDEMDGEDDSTTSTDSLSSNGTSEMKREGASTPEPGDVSPGRARSVERGRITITQIRSRSRSQSSSPSERTTKIQVVQHNNPEGDHEVLLQPPPPPPPQQQQQQQQQAAAPAAAQPGGQWVIPHANSTPVPATPAPPLNVPQYGSRRMLMPSPLPSPVQSARKIFGKKKHRGGSSGSDSYDSSDSEDDSVREEKRRKREEESLSRLVQMAKAQQNFAAAWFAASQGGDENAGIPISPIKRRTSNGSSLRSRSPSPARSSRSIPSTVSSGSGGGSSGPIDVDSGEAWSSSSSDSDSDSDDSDSDDSKSSTASGKMRGFMKAVARKSKQARKSAKRSRKGDDGSFAAATTASMSSPSSRESVDSRKKPAKRGSGSASASGSGSDASSTTSSHTSSSSRSVRQFLKRGAQLDLETGGVIDIDHAQSLSSGGNVAGCSSGDDDSSDGSQTFLFFFKRSRKRNRVPITLILTGVIVVCLGLAAAFIGMSVGGGGGGDDNDPDKAQSGLPGVATKPPTSPPTITASPSFRPTLRPTMSPSSSPTTAPTTPFPTLSPTHAPSLSPSRAPSEVPSDLPSTAPSPVPTVAPSETPTPLPTMGPSQAPSRAPTTTPTASPTQSFAPSQAPTQAPSTVYSTTVLRQIGQNITANMVNSQHGYAISMNDDGSIVAIGSRYNSAVAGRSGEVRIYRHRAANAVDGEEAWEEMGEPLRGRNSVDQFGFSLSLSSAGTRIAISEPGFDDPDVAPGLGDRAGNVRVFDYNATSDAWTMVGNEIRGEARTNLFGVSVDLSGDGKRLVAGAPYHDADGYTASGRVRVFEYNVTEDVWVHVGEPFDGQDDLDWLGWDVALSENGTSVIMGAPKDGDGGYARVYSLNEGTVPPKWKLIGNTNLVSPYPKTPEFDDSFGWSVSISSDATRVAVGSPQKDAEGLANNGVVTVFERSSSATNGWDQLGENLVGDDENNLFGWSAQLSSNGMYLAVGAPFHSKHGPKTGQARVHKWDGVRWDRTQPLYGDDTLDDFGFAVSISGDGKVLGVGAPLSSNRPGNGYGRVFREEED